MMRAQQVHRPATLAEVREFHTELPKSWNRAAMVAVSGPLVYGLTIGPNGRV